MSAAGPDEPLSAARAAELLSPYLSIPRGGVVLAVSGGPDSVALMRLAARIPGRSAVVHVATVDHGLRAESAAEAADVAAWAAQDGLSHAILRWSGDKPRARLQEAARAARYALLADFARSVGASHVMTAHTLDDQAETVVMRLARGSGIGGLAAMRPETVQDGLTIARPLLTVRKAALVATCAAEGWPWRQDPSNADPRFTRVRLRALMPLLAAEGADAERLGLLARRAARADEALERRAAQVFATVGAWSGQDLAIDGTLLAEEPDEIVLRVLRLAIHALTPGEGPDNFRPRLEQVEALADRLAAHLRAPMGREQTAFSANVSGVLVTRRRAGPVRLRPEPPRRR